MSYVKSSPFSGLSTRDCTGNCPVESMLERPSSLSLLAYPIRCYPEGLPRRARYSEPYHDNAHLYRIRASSLKPKSRIQIWYATRLKQLELPTKFLTGLTQNGGYINPPREKRQHRDPYGDWWDKVERRNFGEPVHEDNDVLGMLSPEDYNHFTPAWGAVLLGTFVAAFFGVLGVVYVFHPEKPMHPRRFPGGLDKELGGAGAVHVSVGILVSSMYITDGEPGFE